MMDSLRYNCLLFLLYMQYQEYLKTAARDCLPCRQKNVAAKNALRKKCLVQSATLKLALLLFQK
jgi:hypothetical protein